MIQDLDITEQEWEMLVDNVLLDVLYDLQNDTLLEYWAEAGADV